MNEKAQSIQVADTLTQRGGRLSLLFSGAVLLGVLGCDQPQDSHTVVADELAVYDNNEGAAAMGPSGQYCDSDNMLWPGQVSLDDRQEFRFSLSQDGRTAYYHVDSNETPHQTIYETHRTYGKWSEGVAVSFSGTFPDSDPFLSPDGTTMFFSSIRPIDGEQRERTDIWKVERSGDGWGEPVPLSLEINTDAEELYPSVTLDGTLYWSSGTFTVDGDFNLYSATLGDHGEYNLPELLGPTINTSEYWEFNPWVSPYGHLLFFASGDRPDGYGASDLYVSVKIFGEWLPALNLGANVNTESHEFHPTFLPNWGTLVYVRLTGEKFESNFYWSRGHCLLD